MAELNSSITSPFVAKKYKFSPKLRIGVLASGFGSNFEALVLAINNGYLSAVIPLIIINNHDSKAINKAEKYNIPYKIINHKDFSSRQDFDLKIIDEFNSVQIEGIVMAGWMRIATNTLIEKYPNRIINIHPSILPSFKGADAIEQALKSGTKITGCTVHIVEKDVDSGPIIIQSAVAISSSDTYKSLKNKIQEREHHILPIGLSIVATKWRESTDRMAD